MYKRMLPREEHSSTSRGGGSRRCQIWRRISVGRVYEAGDYEALFDVLGAISQYFLIVLVALMAITQLTAYSTV